MSSNPNPKIINIIAILESISDTGVWRDGCDGCLGQVAVGKDMVVRNPDCLDLHGGKCLRLEVETALRKANKL